MPRSSIPEPIDNAAWLIERTSGNTASLVENMPGEIRVVMDAVLDAAALAATPEDAIEAIEGAYAVFMDVGGTPGQRRRSMRVLPGGT